jgi:hypothetical protein
MATMWLERRGLPRGRWASYELAVNGKVLGNVWYAGSIGDKWRAATKGGETKRFPTRMAAEAALIEGGR